MRRPLKPFVTEYKGSSRRPSPTVPEQPAPDKERSAPKSFAAIPRPDIEDSYEAAMRAADALFSSSPRKREGEVREPSGDVAQNARSDGTGTEPATEKKVGRILRVIDEPPAPAYAALEAAHTPKRRGRKPGSKNKPKVRVAVVAEADAEPAFQPAPGAPTGTPAARKIPALASNSALANRAPPPAATMAAAAQRIVSAAQLGDKRFPWVRDKLKPGEEWKRRRLPRICW